MPYIKPSRFFYYADILMGVCDNATSPINVVSNVGPCDLKCHYSYNYPQMKLTAYNRTEYLTFEADDATSQRITKSPVSYNNGWYEVSEIRIYSPSIHQYGGKKAAAEILIIHQGLTSAKPLIVSIPVQDGGTIGGPMGSLDAMIAAAVTSPASGLGALGAGVPVNLTGFTLNDVVPAKSFFSYSGTLPFNPPKCGTEADFVVFNIGDALSITSKTAGFLSKHVTDAAFVVRAAAGRLYFNKAGAMKGLASSEGDGIYIDCQPTGEEGKTLVVQDTGLSMLESPLVKQLVSMGTQLFVGGLIMAILWVIGTKLVASAKKAGGISSGGGSVAKKLGKAALGR
jgi:hypothetical protein